MATRCTIKIENIDYAKVYKHWDGYPEHMLQWLTEFNVDFNKNRPGDAEYKFAQLLRSSVRDDDKYHLDNSKYTGWGVVKIGDECGEAFEYTLHANGSVSMIAV